jgi:hypothetical protein
MSKLKVINEIKIYWKKNYVIYIPKSNENLRYEKYILFILFTNHVFGFIFSKEWSLKVYSIIKFKYFSSEMNLHFL